MKNEIGSGLKIYTIWKKITDDFEIDSFKYKIEELSNKVKILLMKIKKLKVPKIKINEIKQNSKD